jgi:glucosylceramidase
MKSFFRGRQELFYGIIGAIFLSLSIHASCNKGGGSEQPPPANGTVEQWFTNTAQTKLIEKQSSLLAFQSKDPGGIQIEINETEVNQTVDGFGYTLTGSSAMLINSMAVAERSKLLNELFGKASGSIQVSYLRLSLGASDLSPFVFSYNDLPAGQTDPMLSKFNLSLDTVDLIPVMKEILAINPNIKLMASPWSAPAWMKSNGSSIGGSLLPAWYATYAQYFVKYIQAMKARGITIDAITVQNEPQHGGNNPSMVMSSAEQADFVKNHLGPAFQTAGITTKIIIWDHNCDNPNYPISILNDAAAKQFINGSAFHLYAGNISALSQVHAAHPDRDLYFTEQWTSSTGNFGGDLMWHMQNVIIGSMRNRAKTALEWNLANDASFGPHTPGGCTQCKGALTITGSTVTRNVSYYIIGQVSKFVPPGSKVIKSVSPGNVPQVAFITPEGKKVLLVANEGNGTLNFSIKWNNSFATGQLPGGTVATYVW